ncbi:hypothetical protein JCM3775_005790 [Rhodotorula graminis]|uniref:Mitochondrial outer membrane transport complex Sam37/metaxin N-terminal domain-containing protein n=1 Tax=Rhodotorula graminis (strain WP1) TaxID=578459 RepID=A0A194S4G1_RHOGW|nr:uncharacterized protein RHOBADRAFT_52671 [Rhodotorula graminis WP1]KPV75623.1 hypothetical protein RHOBADRAFT_52671 [Rhodotorula graminis WP1]
MSAPALQLHALPGSSKHDLASLDPDSLVAASYLQLLHPGEWALVSTPDPGSSSSPSAPVLHSHNDTWTGSAILHHLVQTSSSPPNLDPRHEADARAFHALLDHNLLPLVLHSLYSLPQNWAFVRSLLLPSFPFPTAFTRPTALRHAAHAVVDATHPDWWGLGGEADKEADDERRRKKALLETGIDGIKERNDLTRRDGKERVKKTFGEGKIVAAARELFTALESTLASSSTPFFFSSSSPTPLDAHLSSLLSLVLFLPLPTPLLADLINASFPRLWAHAALLRRALWSPESVPPPVALGPAASSSAKRTSSSSWLATLRALVPDLPFGLTGSSGVTRAGKAVPRSAPPTAAQRALARNRRAFVAVCVVGVVGWLAGTGQLPVPGGKLGRLLLGGKAPRGGWVRFRAGTGEGDDEDDEDGEWEEEEDDEEDDEDDLDDE